MAYPFNETFASGIPLGFGSAGGSGAVTATWNESAQAADLDFSAQTNFWKITAAEQSSDFWFEMDVEITASDYAYPQLGFWLWDGQATYEGHQLFILNGTWEYSDWDAQGAESEVERRTQAAWAVIGARKVLRLDVKKSAEGIWAVQLSIDGAPEAAYVRRRWSTFIPCIFGYGVDLRLHRAAGGTPSALGNAPAISHHGLLPIVIRRILIPEHAEALAFNARGFHWEAGNRNHYYHGNYRIAGTVKQKHLPNDIPVSRRVLLVDERTYFVVREAWSDPITGEYSFDYIAPNILYQVVAYDHPHNYRAAIADNLTAEPMP